MNSFDCKFLGGWKLEERPNLNPYESLFMFLETIVRNSEDSVRSRDEIARKRPILIEFT